MHSNSVGPMKGHQESWPVIETMKVLGCKKATVTIDGDDRVSIDLIDVPEHISTAPVTNASTLEGMKWHTEDGMKGLSIQQEARKNQALIEETMSKSRQNMINGIDVAESDRRRKEADAMAHKAMLNSMQKKQRSLTLHPPKTERLSALLK